MKVLYRTRNDCDHLLGQFLDDTMYDTLIDYDADAYEQDPLDHQKASEDNVLFMFRKRYFSSEQQAGAYEGLREAAQQSQNRGLAAGPRGAKCLQRDWVTNEQLEILEFLAKIDDVPSSYDITVCKARASKRIETRGLVWLRDEVKTHNFVWEDWLKGQVCLSPETVRMNTWWVQDNLISDTTYANPVDSGIAGYFDRYPRIPYARPTAYTQQNFEKFKLCYPFMERLALGFEGLLPERYATQMESADRIDPSFRIPNTPFTTITVNKNFRTAAHRDAGDLASGFSNLTVVAKDNDYEGGYLILPEYHVAINVRPGDLLLVANHTAIHGNTPITGKPGFERISLVCYFREKLLEAGERLYEDYRYQYIEGRRKNKDHKLWRDGWNGISPGWESDDEWKQFLLSKPEGERYLKMYHPDLIQEESSLEHLFGDTQLEAGQIY